MALDLRPPEQIRAPQILIARIYIYLILYIGRPPDEANGIVIHGWVSEWGFTYTYIYIYINIYIYIFTYIYIYIFIYIYIYLIVYIDFYIFKIDLSK